MIRFWLPVILWGALMITLSTDVGSSRHTYRALVPVLRWIDPQISWARIAQVNFYLRKTAHLSEYAVFAVLFWRALTHPKKGEIRGWSWKLALLVIAVMALFALGDEYHQSFVPSRTCSPRDVAIDTCGSIFGLTLVGIRHSLRRKDSGLPPGALDAVG